MEMIEIVPEILFYTHKTTKKTIEYREYREVFEKELKCRWKAMSEKERIENCDNEIAVLHCLMSDCNEFNDYYGSDSQGNPLQGEIL